MEMDSSFILKQFVAIDELRPSYISSAMDDFCKVYARAVLKLLSLLTKEFCSYGMVKREYFFNPKNRKGLVSLERSHLVGICSIKYEGDSDFESFDAIHYQGNTYSFSGIYRDPLQVGVEATGGVIPLKDIVWWEQLYNCLCREFEEIKQKKESKS